MMKICFVGLGSIGKRHIRNLCKILGDKKNFTIDAIRKTNSELPDDIKGIISNYYYDIDMAPKDYDIVFITNPTSIHYYTIKKMVPHTKHMFIEKPVFQFPVENIDELKLNRDGVYYVAAPLRYGSVISKINEIIKNEKVFSVRAISSSYLPEWRTGIDYRENYSAHKDMGGGVRLDIIHEIDYLTYMFGMPDTVSYFGGKFSNLEIDSDDLGTYLLKYSDKIIELHLDYFGRRTIRNVEIYCKDYTIYGDLVNNKLKKIYADHDEEIYVPEDQDYVNELKTFLSMIDGKVNNQNSIHHANEVLKLALGGE